LWSRNKSCKDNFTVAETGLAIKEVRVRVAAVLVILSIFSVLVVAPIAVPSYSQSSSATTDESKALASRSLA
jgi:hypothetical protein